VCPEVYASVAGLHKKHATSGVGTISSNKLYPVYFINIFLIEENEKSCVPCFQVWFSEHV
jgi:hypothetical protein